MSWCLPEELTREHVFPCLAFADQASLRVNRTLREHGAHVQRVLLLGDVEWSTAQYCHLLDHGIREVRALRIRIKRRREERVAAWRCVLHRIRTWRTLCVRCGMLDNPDSELCETPTCRWRKHARCVRCTVIVLGSVRDPLCAECR